MKGDDVDVTRSPRRKWHEPDGGRYIGTGSFNVTRDPEEGWINCGTYRVMIHDAKSVGFYISPGKHGRQMRDKYMARNEPMPVAVVCGGDPMTFLMACERGALRRVRVRRGRRHARQAGRGGQGSDHRVCRFRPMPRSSSRATCSPATRRSRGRSASGPAITPATLRPEPVLDIKAIYYRNNPILLGCAPQRPPDEICRYRSIVRSAMLRENIQKAGVPGVTAAWAHEVGNARLLLAVAIKQRYPGHATAGRPHRRHVPRRRLLRAVRDRGRRRHRRVQPRGGDLGAAHALRSRHLDRHHPATPGRRRSTRASSPSARRRATTPTAAPSSTPAGPGTGATSSRRSTCRRRRSGARRFASSGISWIADAAARKKMMATSVLALRAACATLVWALLLIAQPCAPAAAQV